MQFDTNNVMYKDVKRILFTQEQLSKRVQELADEISRDYKDSDLLMVAILKGSVIFYGDLLRAMSISAEMDFMSISSYGSGTKSSGEVKMIKDLDKKIENKDVIIVEDIVDSGRTLSYLKKLLYARNPKSVKICALLNKYERREVEIDADYTGFDIENEFVIGYGLDYDGKYRNLPEIAILKPEVYEE